MGFVTILRELWRRRMLVAAVAVVSILVGFLMAYQVSLFSVESRQHDVGIASARALVDTPSSQVVDLGSATGADIGTLSARANLLASLMASSPIKDDIARRASIPKDLFVTPASASVGAPAAAAPPDVSGAAISVDDPRAFVLRSSVPTLESGEVPIIAVDTRAPDAESAAQLADVAIAVLRSHLVTVAGTDAVPLKRRVTVRSLGPARSATDVRGPSRLMAFVAALFVFGGGCAAILGAVYLMRGWRRASQLDSPRRRSALAFRGPTPADVGREPQDGASSAAAAHASTTVDAVYDFDGAAGPRVALPAWLEPGPDRT